MENTLFKWLLNLLNVFTDFMGWLTTPILGEFSMLSLFSITGLIFLITLLVGHLLNFFN